ncbi:MAG: hypothetical protein K6E89_02070 [Sphaerochaetaceae bacterium]|nr:hypothetical protein [Sphaerochaetaceae bacterium]
MRKYILIIITIIAALLVSCNIDATDGIYSEAAASTESTSVTTRNFLGQNSSGQYFYLTDEGVFRIGTENALFSSTETKVIRGASLCDDAGSLLILRQNSTPSDGAVISYHAFNGTSYDAAVDVEGKFNGILTNGLYYNNAVYDGETITKNGGIYKYGSADSLVADIKSIMYTLVSGDHAFFCVKHTSDNYKFYVISADGSIEVNGIGASESLTTYIGFQAIDASNFVLLQYKSNNSKLEAYKMSATEIAADSYVTLQSSVPYEYSAQAMSFIYNDEIYFKCTSYFEKIKTDDTTEQINTGFAANLRTAEITDILPALDTDGNVRDGYFVAGTKSSMLYLIDLVNNTSSRITN